MFLLLVSLLGPASIRKTAPAKEVFYDNQAVEIDRVRAAFFFAPAAAFITIVTAGLPMSHAIKALKYNPTATLRLLATTTAIVEGWQLTLLSQTAKTPLAEFATNPRFIGDLDLSLFIYDHRVLFVLSVAATLFLQGFLSNLVWPLFLKYPLGLMPSFLNYALTTSICIGIYGWIGISSLILGLVTYFILVKPCPDLASYVVVAPIALKV
jgi:hypothetical protein